MPPSDVLDGVDLAALTDEQLLTLAASTQDKLDRARATLNERRALVLVELVKRGVEKKRIAAACGISDVAIGKAIERYRNAL